MKCPQLHITARCLCGIASQPQQSVAGKSTATAFAYPSTDRSSISTASTTGSRQTVLHCAHRATTVSSWGLCEQEGWSGGSPFPSQGARSGSTGPAWVPPAYSSSSLVIPFGGGWPDWSLTARNFLTRPPTGTPRRAISPGEGLRRPRVAQAQEINRLPSPSAQSPFTCLPH